MSLKTEAASGVRWVALSSGMRFALMMGRLTVITRLLEVRELGLASMAAVVLGYANAYVDMGLSTAIIQKRETDERKLSTLFWLNVGGGALAAAVVYALRQPIAGLFGSEALAGLLPLAAVHIAIISVGRQPAALFRRQLEFRRIALLQVAGDLVNTAVAIGLAWRGYGALSLVAAAVAGAALQNAGLLVSGLRRWPVRAHFDLESVRPHLSFGFYELGKLNAGYLAANADKFLIARYLGPESVGLYTVAQRLTQIPRSFVIPTVSKVALPIFSQQQDRPQQMLGAYWTLQKSLAYLNLPLIVGLLMTCHLAVPLLYGSKYHGAIVIVQWLSVLTAITSISGPTQLVRTALGMVRFNFHWSWASGLLITLVLWVGAREGLMPMVWARVACGWLSSLVLIGLTLGVLDSNLWGFVRNVARPVAATAIMVVAVLGALAVVSERSPWLQLPVVVAAGGLTYVGAAWALDAAFLRENLLVLLGRKRQPPTPSR